MLKVLKSTLAVALIATMIACSTSWVTEAVNILKVVTPAAVNVLTLISAFSGQPVNQTAAATITNDVNVAITLIQDYSTASAAAQPGVVAQLNAALATTQADLNTFLSTAGIKDQKKLAEASAIVTFVIAEVAAVASLVPAPAAPVAAKRAQKIPISAKQFKKNYNVLMAPLNPALVIK